MGSLEKFVEIAVEKLLAKKYPHIRYPTIVHAKIANVKRLGTYNEYTLRVLDRFGNIDSTFPELPGVLARSLFELGTTVIIAFPYGDPTAQIIGEVIL